LQQQQQTKDAAITASGSGLTSLDLISELFSHTSFHYLCNAKNDSFKYIYVDPDTYGGIQYPHCQKGDTTSAAAAAAADGEKDARSCRIAPLPQHCFYSVLLQTDMHGQSKTDIRTHKIAIAAGGRARKKRSSKDGRKEKKREVDEKKKNVAPPRPTGRERVSVSPAKSATKLAREKRALNFLDKHSARCGDAFLVGCLQKEE
jgi:hypothetical protein